MTTNDPEVTRRIAGLLVRYAADMQEAAVRTAATPDSNGRHLAIQTERFETYVPGAADGLANLGAEFDPDMSIRDAVFTAIEQMGDRPAANTPEREAWYNSVVNILVTSWGDEAQDWEP